ncbi:MAG: DUF2179 domain-containing protein [Planctomycetota bacterium]|nr:MAG: DUF2179 domain-containing protein [Planctomycetota bacterium]
MEIFGSDAFTYIVLPALIFLARVCDVTIGTIRIIFVSRGHKFLAPLVGFFEILIWLVAIGKIFENLDNVTCYIAYAGGFAAGNFVGIYIEERLAMGTLVIRVITRKGASELITGLRSAGYGATSIAAQGGSGTVSVIYSVIKRSDLDDVVAIIKKFNPKAFYSIEDVRFVSEGVFPLNKSGPRRNVFGLAKLFRVRKGK